MSNRVSKIINLNIKKQEEKGGKRLEEQYKLVFKRGLRKILDAFKVRNQLRGRKKESEAERKFYAEYFQEVFEKYEVRMTFSDEARQSPSLAVALFNPTTINAFYVEAVLSCPRFESEFRIFVEQYFVKEYSRVREGKLRNLLEKCLQFFIEDAESAEKKVKQYVMKNKQTKLPWSNQELLQAAKRVKKVLDKKRKLEHYCNKSKLMQGEKVKREKKSKIA